MHPTCHHCDYDLMGLPDKGTCPECGEIYDKHSSFRAARSGQSAVDRHIKWIALAVFTVVVVLIGATIAIATKNWGAVALALVIAGVSGFGSFAYWWSERQDRRASQ